MRLPRKLKGFNAFLDGLNLDGECIEMTRPKIARKFEDYRPGGMDGTAKIDMGGEELECELKFGGYMEEVIARMGESINGTQIRLQGALQREDSGDYDELRIELRGRFAEIDPGSAKAGDDTETSTKFNPTYYKEILNGKTLCEIDILAGKWFTNGTDRLAGKRKALGLG